MSTKIYEAFRFPLNRFHETIDWAHDTLFDQAKTTTEAFMAKLALEKTAPDHIDRKDTERLQRWEQAQRLNTIFDLVKKAEADPYKSPFNLSCGLNLWIHPTDGYVYAIPIGEHIQALEENRPEWVQDFAYWNNTDQPEDITNKEWQHRAKTWDQLCTGPQDSKTNHNARRLYHEVIDGKTDTGLFDLKWAILGAKAF